MLDINFIRDNKEIIKKAITDKGIDLDLENLLEIDQARRDLILKVEELRRKRNAAAQLRDIEKGKAIKQELGTLEKELAEIENRFKEMMLFIPNIPSLDSPIGPDSLSNVEIKKWGENPQFSFTPKDHVELSKALGIVDFEAGVKVSGFRGYFLKGQGALLHLAVLNYALGKIVKAGFTPMIPPTLVSERVLIGSGHFPFGKEGIYQIANPGKIETGEEIKNPVFLVGTSEPSLLGYFADRTLSEAELPIKVAGISSCYRSEVGDYGRDTKGLYRVHEFAKVEQVVICRNDLAESEKLFGEIQQISEGILQELGIPYHVIVTSTGDMGAGKYQMNDIEAWMPGRGSYGETHSNSNLTDWQARRLNLKFKDKAGETHLCYTLNNTVIASPRVLIAILENFQQEDGSVIIPEALRPYTGFDKIS
ncbi:serine--tRNA ligase [Candidatus Daviesbacteria bacterium RIFCSPHIGHO2_01_FULL_44_29]|uniref:Serine--tRNA ligase n=1 Tax=Candidatus Daviesbacteria bacterium RIFCSPHIGHO2_02_FULL_43_12 TaxID=1797776 RepID=A0A1F5KKP1_9BACT|nr:MAG: serine--tRNA ligase [Candidatus Daviesbacteria bacterium RIFCSPHIGHO2_01_FULL_44_29]OGE40301.1 MAG: serine--tRNA ligase [Candidatus Daviesbacteria bacterium RIFCSPHIGHO2_12_FULL_47_45]OGE41399.1 MAG: serine--tRNA ligase [Candidatus Daviesbacteria bacterium RIFCSPHIGHO2_02_FULL_43_12]OGE69599.1 MAG: serine--tRNA ligase [Candidatus Daviesbacteria bacterium RIFCSPLOWO2_01_FULL_43_15]